MFKYLQIYTFVQSCFSVGYILSSRSLCSILFSHKHHSQESQYYAGVPAYISPSRGRTISGATGPINRGAWRNEVRWRQGQEASLPPPCSQMSSFGSKCTALKTARVTLLGLSAPSAVILRPHPPQ